MNVSGGGDNVGDFASLGKLDYLPVELREMIFAYMTPQELCAQCTVSKAWYALVESESLWRALFMADFSFALLSTQPESAWKLAYRKHYEGSSVLIWGNHQHAISVDGMKCSVPPKVVGPWKTAITTNKFTGGIHYWEVRVLKHYSSPSIISVKIGVLPEPILERGSIETTDCPGWICGRSLSYCGVLDSAPGLYQEGDVIGVLLNLEDSSHWMSFYRNGKLQSGRYYFVEELEIKETGFYPAIALDYGGEVELCPKGIVLKDVPEGDLDFELYNKWKEAGGKLPATPHSRERAGKKVFSLARLFGFSK